VAQREGSINRTLPLRSLPLGPLRKLAATRWQRVRTCNLALWRRDFATVNGFDEAYAGWGFEDSDLAVRLLNAGVRRKEGAFATGVLHLWHRENDRRFEGENLARLQAAHRLAHHAHRARRRSVRPTGGDRRMTARPTHPRQRRRCWCACPTTSATR
jgi:hypothetical protein